MRILIYEWCCSGGLTAGTSGNAGNEDPLCAEGRAMFAALVRDACRDPRLDVTALVDASRPMALPPPARIRRVPAGGDVDAVVAAAAGADATLIVAPEAGGLLADRVAAVRAAGAAVVAPDGPFIAIAADKQATVEALAAAGVPVPAGRSLAANAPWPEWFIRPAVRKPLDGAGGDGLVTILPGEPAVPAPHPCRIEAFAPGDPIGIACLCGPGGIRPLAPLRQCRDAAGRYVGGAPLASPAAAARATALALRAVAAVARAAAAQPRGGVGVDMILGSAADGRDDRVLEVNPRLTTSFVGHAAGWPASLVATLLDVAAGREPPIVSQPRAFRLVTDAPSCPRA
jgi:predicted ATP-grasp superfamily ATP-dependent carboligase